MAKPKISDALAEQVESAIDEIVAQICPDAVGRPMYGGVLYEREPGVFHTGVCGVFCYKHHISIEFSQGFLLKDDAGVLEGKGKLRRHIKLRSVDDLQSKSVAQYIEQAFVLS